MLTKHPNNKEDTMKSFTTLTVTQNEFLESYLRGTGRTMSAAQAQATYGIQNLRARMSELRQAGLKVKRELNTEGRTAYRVSARDVDGSRSYVFV
jgi:Helix-turn-helix domain